MVNRIGRHFDKAEEVKRPIPLPLRRDSGTAESFPIKALGKLLAGAVYGIVDKVQCPDALAAQSVLAAAALAAQPHADIIHPANGGRIPLSLFLVTVAASGERKSTADKIALGPIGLREAELHEQYERDLPAHKNAQELYDRDREAIKKLKGGREERAEEMKKLGRPPTAPLAPLLKTADPTLEGLQKLMAIGQPSMGLFTDEGGAFVGGYSFQDEVRVRTGAGLSSLWDGTPISRVRGTDGWMTLRGRRLSLHIMIQPGIAGSLLADPALQSQGLPSRFLVSAPASIAGTRMQKPLKASTEPALKKYQTALLQLLQKPPRRTGLANAELDPNPIHLSATAIKKWAAFADECERNLAAGERLEPVRAFANKLSEHALRLAGILALIDEPEAREVSAEVFDRAVVLARYYAGEALRLFEQGAASVEIERAEKVLTWLQGSWKQPRIGLTLIYQNGPNSIREAGLARQAMAVLEQHFWVVRIEGGTKIAGKHHREAWEIVDP